MLSHNLLNQTQPVITCSKLTIETLEQSVNFEHISHFVLVFLLLSLSRLVPTGMKIGYVKYLKVYDYRRK